MTGIIVKLLLLAALYAAARWCVDTDEDAVGLAVILVIAWVCGDVSGSFREIGVANRNRPSDIADTFCRHCGDYRSECGCAVATKPEVR